MSDTMRRAMIAVLGSVCVSGLIAVAEADEITAATAPQVAQQTEQKDQDQDKWVFTAPLYLWAPGISGSVTSHGRTGHFDVGFDQLLDNMEVGFIAYFQLAKPEYGFYVEPQYDSFVTKGKSDSIKASLETQLAIIEFGAFYRILYSGGDHPGSLYLVGGGRYWYLHNLLRVKDPVAGTQSGGKMDWLIDPIVGLRYTQYFTQRIHGWVQADVGGFGLSAQTSRFSWQIEPLLGIDFTMPVVKFPSTAFGGWRWLDDQHVQGSNSYHIMFDGLVVGLNVMLF